MGSDENSADSGHEETTAESRSAGDEASRMISESDLEGDARRRAEGWERRFIADAQRAEEAMELYASLGYEVCADPVTAEEMGIECADCRLLALQRFKTIYTRKRRPDKQEL